MQPQMHQQPPSWVPLRKLTVHSENVALPPYISQLQRSMQPQSPNVVVNPHEGAARFLVAGMSPYCSIASGPISQVASRDPSYMLSQTCRSLAPQMWQQQVQKKLQSLVPLPKQTLPGQNIILPTQVSQLQKPVQLNCPNNVKIAQEGAPSILVAGMPERSCMASGSPAEIEWKINSRPQSAHLDVRSEASCVRRVETSGQCGLNPRIVAPRQGHSAQDPAVVNNSEIDAFLDSLLRENVKYGEDLKANLWQDISLTPLMDSTPPSGGDNVVPVVLKLEIISLTTRFRIELSPGQPLGHVGGALQLVCHLDHHDLPVVPELTVNVPRNYPYQSPVVTMDPFDHLETPFLFKVANRFNLQLEKVPKNFTVSQLLTWWEMCVRAIYVPGHFKDLTFDTVWAI